MGRRRRRRSLERFAIWGVLLGALALTGAALWVGHSLYGSLARGTSTSTPSASAADVPPPPIEQTPVIVWNGLGADGVAAEAARQLMVRKYPIVTVGNAPDQSYMRTYVMYQHGDPAGPAAARALIKRMRLDGAVAQPMDGIRKDQLAGARLLVIIADPLTSH